MSSFFSDFMRKPFNLLSSFKPQTYDLLNKLKPPTFDWMRRNSNSCLNKDVNGFCVDKFNTTVINNTFSNLPPFNSSSDISMQGVLNPLNITLTNNTLSSSALINDNIKLSESSRIETLNKMLSIPLAANKCRSSFFPTFFSKAEENVQIELGKRLCKLYSCPAVTDKDINNYLPGNSRISSRLSDIDYKFKLFISKSGVPILAQNYVREGYEVMVPYEAVYAAAETVDLFMSKLEPHVRKRILDTKLFVNIADPKRSTDLNDYSGWYRLATRENLNNNEVDVAINSVLPNLVSGDLCNQSEDNYKLHPGSVRESVLIHELTHAVQALLPYKDRVTGEIKNWNKLTEFPPHIKEAIESAKISPDVNFSEYVKKGQTIGNLSLDDMLMAKDIQFNVRVADAFKEAQKNPHYAARISKNAHHGDYQMKKESTAWHEAGTEYFAELVPGAFGLQLNYAFSPEETGLKEFTGRMATPDWIKQNDPIGWGLINEKFGDLSSDYCKLPLLSQQYFCRNNK